MMKLSALTEARKLEAGLAEIDAKVAEIERSQVLIVHLGGVEVTAQVLGFEGLCAVKAGVVELLRERRKPLLEKLAELGFEP